MWKEEGSFPVRVFSCSSHVIDFTSRTFSKEPTNLRFLIGLLYCLLPTAYTIVAFLLKMSYIVFWFNAITEYHFRSVFAGIWWRFQKTISLQIISWYCSEWGDNNKAIVFLGYMKYKKIWHSYFINYAYFVLYITPSDLARKGKEKAWKKWLIVFQACLAKYRDNFRRKTWWARQFCRQFYPAIPSTMYVWSTITSHSAPKQ